jgi:hypothetical protein
VKLEQLPQGDALDRTETLAVVVVEEFLGLLRAEAFNHTSSMLRNTLYVKRIRSSKIGRKQAQNLGEDYGQHRKASRDSRPVWAVISFVYKFCH